MNMRTKIVYVVSSDEEDYYLEQALLSVFSLRKHNPGVFVEIVMDQFTHLTLNGKRTEISKYVDKITVADVPEKYDKGQKSRWIKTSLRNHIDGDYLFIDTDTIITDSLEEIDGFIGEMGAVKDHHTNAGKNCGKSKLLEWSKQDGWSFFDDLIYFNSGVMFVRDCDLSHEFYQEWNKRWIDSCERYSRFYDQSPLAATNQFFHYPIKEIDGAWNCQPIGGLAYMHKAIIMHYLSDRNDAAWLFNDKDILREIKRTGSISEKVSDLVDDAKGAFLTPNRLIAGRDLEVFYSPVFRVCKANNTVLFFFNGLSYFILGIGKVFRRIAKVLKLNCK